MYERLEALGIELVHLDVKRHTIPDSFVDKEKVSSKNRPTFLLRADDGLHKVKPENLRHEFPQGLKNELNRVGGNRFIWSVKDLAGVLKANNTELDSLTVVYCHDPELKEYPSHAIRVLRHESQHQLVEVRDVALAEKLKMKPGRFYWYYKPSHINGFS